MEKTKQRAFPCAIANVKVVIFSQSYTFSGIGSQYCKVQTDYQCSKEKTCTYSIRSECSVRKLNNA